MTHIELVVFGLLLAIVAFGVAARMLRIPYPILLFLGGLAIASIPGVPEVELDPDLVLLIFLPPLLYGAAFFTSLVELRSHAKEIGALAMGLVALTMSAVAVLGHEVIGLSWPVAFVLGAVVSPTDAVAPAEILRRLNVPRRALTLIEGESLTNDWTALVLYKFAVAAVVTGSFSLLDASVDFVLSGVGGVGIGLVAGWVIAQIRARLDDPPIEITISLLTGYAAYLPAEELGASGILAAVTAGIYLGWHTPRLTTATTRIELIAIWSSLQFLLNGVLFVLIGFQLPQILDGLGGRDPAELAVWGVLVWVLVTVVRVIWVLGFTYVPRLVTRRGRNGGSLPAVDQVAIVSWSGMRGSVSLAAAFAIPFTVDAGGAFPDRELVIFLAFCVLVGTLALQGLTLPLLIRKLDIEDDGLERDLELAARLEAAYAALDRLEELKGADWVREDTFDRTRRLFEYRARRFASRVDGTNEYEEQSRAYQRLQRELIAAQRERLLELRATRAINDDVRRAVERDLDLEESRLEGA